MTEGAHIRKKSNLAFVAVVVVLLAALGAEGFVILRPSFSRGRRPIEAQRAIAAASNEITTFGQKSAPIKIEFYAPLVLEWHKQTIGLLRQYHKQHPGRIHVTLMPMGNSDCDTEMLRRGYSCAVIFINGETEFTLPNSREVMLEKKPNTADSLYNSEDVITIVEQMVQNSGQ